MTAKLSSKITFKDRDEFTRKPIAEKIIKLLESNINVSPMVIDGNWGTGKTEFCYKLINLIKEEHKEYLPIYVDAFKADHADEPLMTLLAAILSKFSDDEEKQKSFIEKALPMLRFTLKTGLKASIGWVLRQDIANLADEWDKDLKKTGDSIVDSGIESLLADNIKVNDSIKALSGALTTLAEDKPIILFIDELDRCRPDFAISMLEVIKHIFDVDGVQFVLVTNTEQLRASINHCYGLSVNAQRYLDKFVGFSFALPDNALGDDPRYRYDNSSSHFFSLIQGSDIFEGSVFFDVVGEEIEFARRLVETNLSLRESETFVKHLEIYQILTEGKGLQKGMHKGDAFLSIFGVFLFCFHDDLAQTFLGEIKGFRAQDIEKLLKILKMPILECSSISPSINFILGFLCLEIVAEKSGSAPIKSNTFDDYGFTPPDNHVLERCHNAVNKYSKEQQNYFYVTRAIHVLQLEESGHL